MLSLAKNKNVQQKLLAWYDVYARDLPWRHTKDPYKIWVSEIMLQQTQVDTVVPYYQKWIKAFPTVRALANAPLEEILRHWAGLGYYRRARMLHKAAGELISSHQSQLPPDVERLMQIPGIGRYTAGAISSIAFNRPSPLVDGNVIRILSRIFEIRDDVMLADTIKTLWQLAELLVDPKRPGDFNQAMMELGATVCTPDLPQCLTCPLQKECSAYKTGSQNKLPVKLKQEKLQKTKAAALVLCNAQNKILIEQQPKEARWGGLWMFPVRQNKRTIERDFGIRLNKNLPTLTIRHGFTKYMIEMEVFFKTTDLRLQTTDYGLKAKSKKKSKPNNPQLMKTYRLSTMDHGQKVIREGSQPPYESSKHAKSKWITVKDFSQFAFPSHHKKIADYLVENNRGRKCTWI
ncbi:MAG: A/G-specific adenine glycosylase [Candidatus Omnitrophica bacterium]|nr:A/G-specific adenine glycosylase [Candidatus Omnitrophota bacterium]